MLIEDWLPITELGVESQRERGASSALPPLYFLHVWWARRPLTVSRAAIFASLLPSWSEEWPERLKDRFPTEDKYHRWFIRFLGILGDPVAGKKLIEQAKIKNVKLKSNPYGYPRAFTTNPSEEELQVMIELMKLNWGDGDMSMCDPMAGGGSIPFEGLRYGLTVRANELNPVASVILKATLDYPARYGEELAEHILKYGKQLCERVEKELGLYYPTNPGESIFAYIWARTVACPTTGKPVPLSPNWWLSKGDNPVAVRLIAEKTDEQCRFEIVKGEKAEKADPDTGTISGGVAVSPWTGESIDGDYIKVEAQAGRMGQQLFALGVKTKGTSFRTPTADDFRGVELADNAFRSKMTQWERDGLIPTEERYIGPADRSANYGVMRWCDAFSPRQLLAFGTYLEELKNICEEINAELPEDKGRAVRTFLAFAFDKCLNYNSRMSVWHPSRTSMANTFDRHDFSFKWSHGEFDAAHNLLPWALDQVMDAYKGIAKLAEPTRSPLFSTGGIQVVDRLEISNGNAMNLKDCPDASFQLVCVDPPYFANVMYAECSDFFYVWMKRTLGDVYPEFFKSELTNKDDEAVANSSRFASVKGRNKANLAKLDYQHKMAACFREMNRVLKPEGVLTVMFTHKEVAAWDTLAKALIDAGFVIEASWPVHTESEHSLHQAKKNAAESTILLTCRKREKAGEPVWWEDIKSTVRATARKKAEEFEAGGIRGVDLYISTFGPVLSIISESWPVLTGQVDEKTGEQVPLSPEEALEIAREEVIALRKKGLLLGREVRFDPITDWYLIAWDTFRAEKFPADEARKLSIALGLDLEKILVKDKKVLSKSGQFVSLNSPKTRRKKGSVDPEVASFDCMLDAVHTMMMVYTEDGSNACGAFLDFAGLKTDSTFKTCIQAMINAIPRTRDKKGEFLRPEANSLEKIRLAFFEDIEAPPEEEILEEEVTLF